MKVYRVCADAMVTIHPMMEKYIMAHNEEDAKREAEKCFVEQILEDYGYIDYEEINIECNFEKEI